jgi:hypothetical protein
LHSIIFISCLRFVCDIGLCWLFLHNKSRKHALFITRQVTSFISDNFKWLKWEIRFAYPLAILLASSFTTFAYKVSFIALRLSEKVSAQLGTFEIRPETSLLRCHKKELLWWVDHNHKCWKCVKTVFKKVPISLGSNQWLSEKKFAVIPSEPDVVWQ